MELRIGTSGWHYAHWRGPFYPPKLPASQMFAHYQRQFDTVEINNTFYKLPAEETLAAWRERAGTGFQFAVKGSRFLTHMKKLAAADESIDRFFSRIEILGEKAGPILFQLPPNWAVNAERLAAFLQRLPRAYRYAFEFRDKSWFTPEIYDLLIRHRAALCIFDLRGHLSPLDLTTDFTYVRLHGPQTAAYAGRYTKAALHEWANRIEAWRSQLRAVYVYFDNDQAGYAVQNALELKRLTGQTKK